MLLKTQQNQLTGYEDAATDWGTTPTNVNIHGTFTVTAANLAGPATCTFEMADDTALTTTITPIVSAAESITPDGGDYSRPEQGKTIDLETATGFKLTYDRTIGAFKTLSFTPVGDNATEVKLTADKDGNFAGVTLEPKALTPSEDGTITVPETGVKVTGTDTATAAGTYTAVAILKSAETDLKDVSVKSVDFEIQKLALNASTATATGAKVEVKDQAVSAPLTLEITIPTVSATSGGSH